MPPKLSTSVRIYYPRFSREVIIKKITAGIKRVQAFLPVSKAVLFGSYAKGRHTAASDIDLLVVYRGPAREDAFAIVKKKIPIPGLEPHIYSETELAIFKDAVARMTAEGVIIYPQEDNPVKSKVN